MSHSSSYPPACCTSALPELKIYQAFIFSAPIFFTFLLLLLFYLFYLRRRRVNWSSLRMRTEYQARGAIFRQSKSGLKKELREMLPVIIFKESFQIRETQCSVCLGDYQANDRLQQMPSCGHTFHMSCIDHWLANNTTCPLCRLSLLPSPESATERINTQQAASHGRDPREESTREDRDRQSNSTNRVRGEAYGCTNIGSRSSNASSEGEQFWDAVRDLERCGDDQDGSVVIDVEINSSRVQETTVDSVS